MVFSSFKFLFLFLPFFFISYYLVEDRFRNLCIFLYSLVFYAYGCIGNMHYLLILILSLVINYFLGLLISKREKPVHLLILAIIINLGTLFIFKYSRINLVLPIGISFYTFQILSYIFDVYNKTISAEKNFLNLSTYIIMFPQLIAGPIVRYRDVCQDIVNVKEIRKEDIIEGITIFTFGLASKVLLANQLSGVSIDVNAYGYQTMTCATAFLGAVSYTMQIYFDFFGYSLMAIGLGRLMGIHIMRNFDEPYLSTSITEFWRRWHISLGNWFRDYVYIPLGGSRVSLFFTCLNLFIVFSLSGIWHGAQINYMLWGMYFGVLIIIEKLFLLRFFTRYKVIGHIYLLIAITLSFIIFKYENMQDMIIYFKRLFDFSNINENNNFIIILKTNYKAVILGILFVTKIPKMLYNKIVKNDVAKITFALLIFIVCIIFIYRGNNDPFMYFRF